MMPIIKWTCYFLLSRGYGIYENFLLQDNKSLILLEQHGKASSGKRMRHINIQHFFIKEWLNSDLIGVPPRRWLLILWPSLYSAVTSGIWEITSLVEWDYTKAFVISLGQKAKTKSSLRRARWMAIAVSQWPAASAASKLWHNSTSTIVPQEYVGVHKVLGIFKILLPKFTLGIFGILLPKPVISTFGILLPKFLLVIVAILDKVQT